ncbi:IclR family transcriptional regulator [Xanthobacter sp. DSM 24535]|uniref:IclR family transcriptional regulator n=1 Tax=Roseixanthobacter psychrophilus TaxID=3119917 RepID=UPI00372AD5C6
MQTVSLESKQPSQGDRGGPQSVGRIIVILESLSDSCIGATLSELAAITGAPKTSLVGLLAGLTAEGCLLRNEAGQYSIGPRVLSLAMRAMAGRELTSVVRPVLAALVEATGETAVLGAMAPDAELAIYLDKIESSNPIRYTVTAGERRELYCTAMGKALLAYLDPTRIKHYLKTSRLERFTENTITGRADLLAELARIRQDGIARTSEERVEGASGLAAPIFSSDGTVIAAVLIAGPSARMRSKAKRNERLVKDAAAECTRLVGGVAPLAMPKE